MNTNRNKILLAILSFGLYFITGAVCALRGAELYILADIYKVSIDKVVLVGSVFAIGRVLTVYLTGKAVSKYNPLLIMFIGVSFISLYLVGIIIIPSLNISFVLAFFAGVGMGCQDAVCPLFLSYSFKDKYSASLSVGQALYGLGGFALSFLVGLMFTLNVEPTYTNYIVCIVSVILLVLIPFAKYDHSKVNVEIEEEHVKPLFVKNELLGYIAAGVECFLYCMAVNAIATYTSAFGLFKGLNEDTSAYLLTIFNVSCFIGSIVLAFILKKVKEITVLIFNSIITFVALILLFVTNSSIIYFVSFIIIGLFSGVLYSIILAIATRIGYKKIAITSAIIGTAAGVGDIISPVITAYFINVFSIMSVFKFALVLFALQAIIGIYIKKITREEI